MRPWRAYLWPGVAFGLGVLLWPVMALFTNSAIHMYAHGSWAEVLMLAGGAELGLVHGRLSRRGGGSRGRSRSSCRGNAFIVHEQNAWIFARSAFLHHTARLDVHRGAIVPARLIWRPRSAVLRSGFALMVVAGLGAALRRP